MSRSPRRPRAREPTTASRRGAAPPGLRSERRRSERRGKAVPQGRPEASPESTASRRGAAPPGLRSERRRSERRGKAVPQGRPGGEPGKHSEPEGRGAAWAEERGTKERATMEGGASGAPRRRARKIQRAGGASEGGK